MAADATLQEYRPGWSTFSPMPYELSHLRALEAESVHIMREVAAEFERPVLLCSRGAGLDRDVGGWPRRRSGRLGSRSGDAHRHGHNFDEVYAFRDAVWRSWGAGWWWRRCRSRSTRAGVVEQTGPYASRNLVQTVTLLDAIEEHRFDAVFGGARRDEEKARAKERVFSFRDEFGQWDPKNQRPELWSLYNGPASQG